jgi:ABC-type amino acid transport system permease subunit
MTQTTTRFAALALSALMTLATVAGMNRIATTQYAAADSLALTQVAVQHVTIVGHRADA